MPRDSLNSRGVFFELVIILYLSWWDELEAETYLSYFSRYSMVY